MLDLLDPFEFVVTFWVILIRGSGTVRQDLHPAGFEHPHHHRCARSRQTGDDCNTRLIHDPSAVILLKSRDFCSECSKILFQFLSVRLITLLRSWPRSRAPKAPPRGRLRW
jgi:hypothetical protein